MGNFYPVFLSLQGKRCLVAGLGKVGVRKAKGLLRHGAGAVLAFDTGSLAALPVQARELLADRRIMFQNRSCQAADIRSCFLVFAATNDPAENRRIAEICSQEAVICNCVTDPEAGDFFVPALAEKGGLSVAVSTSGQSPFLAAQWRRELEIWLEPRARLAWLMGRLRPLVLSLHKENEYNKYLFQKIAASPIGLWLEQNEPDKCLQWLQDELPPVLREGLPEIFTEYAHAFP